VAWAHRDKVSVHRFGSKPIIWKELQLHNVIFVARSAALMLFFLCFPIAEGSDKGVLEHYMTRFIIVASLHYAADVVTENFQVPNACIPISPARTQARGGKGPGRGGCLFAHAIGRQASVSSPYISCFHLHRIGEGQPQGTSHGTRGLLSGCRGALKSTMQSVSCSQRWLA
jgi:hypothetical protein